MKEVEEQSVSIVNKLQHELKDNLPTKQPQLYRESFISYHSHLLTMPSPPILHSTLAEGFVICDTLH